MSTTGDPIPGQNPEYSPFHPDLDQKYPVGTITFGKDSRDKILSGEVSSLQWVSIFRNSPANNGEAETLIGAILTDAIRAGQWVDIPEPLEDSEIPGLAVETHEGLKVMIPSIPLELKRGAEILANVGFVQKTQNAEGQTFISPTEKLIEFIDTRVGFQKPPTHIKKS